MCGIAGILSTDGRGNIEAMTDVLGHRGPDGHGYYRDNHISLGHRRLSIIDVAGGKQPISNESDSLQLVCNGEIYNSPELRTQLINAGHRFKTKTDVEVILHLYEEYGENCVKHLRGMFAFALWDSENRTLLLARDHLGQKPLFFYQDGASFLFASEIKSILASGIVEPQIDLNGHITSD
jgi:asparagine synthase (glutamine-hydrolysing)